MPPPTRALAGALATGLALAAAPGAAAQEAELASVAPLVVRGERPGDIEALPVQAESVTAGQVAATVNAVNVEDALKYLPNVLIRKRHVGDTQAPMTTRTSGVGASARSLIYADGALISALIGNNNSTASPRWGMVAPQEVARIDVLYGPFAAAYPGNSIGAVVEITTRMPAAFEVHGEVQAISQSFAQYGAKGDFPAYAAGVTLGDRRGPSAWWLSAHYVDSESQPLAYVTAVRPAAPSSAGAPIIGADADLNRLGAPIQVLGAGGFEHQRQDQLKAKLAYDLTPTILATGSLGWFGQDDRGSAETYLRDAGGAPAYAGTFNIAGYAYAVPAGAFSNNVYRLTEGHWMGVAQVRSRTGGVLDFEIVATRYAYATSRQRTPTGALPAAFSGGPGTITDMGGTGWATGEASLTWRPTPAHAVTAGAHIDRYDLKTRRYAAADWIAGPAGALQAASLGSTQTAALWAQDAWRLSPDLRLTLGARWERWRAFDGSNFAAAPALAVTQPERGESRLSPKASLAWTPSDAWKLTASYGGGWRFPTVSELYQAIATGPTLTVPDPNLRAEHANTGEVSVERSTDHARLRLSVFHETVDDALIAQTAPLVPGSGQLFSYVQNIGRTRARGAEVVATFTDILVEGLEISASGTWVDARIVSDPAFPAAVGKHTPQVPTWRGTLVATWRPGERWTFTAAARAAARSYATIDNIDVVTHTYQGFDPYLVVDVRVTWRATDHLTAALGVDNLGDRGYFLFHPFPQRTVLAELRYDY